MFKVTSRAYIEMAISYGKSLLASISRSTKRIVFCYPNREIFVFLY